MVGLWKLGYCTVTTTAERGMFVCFFRGTNTNPRRNGRPRQQRFRILMGINTNNLDYSQEMPLTHFMIAYCREAYLVCHSQPSDDIKLVNIVYWYTFHMYIYSSRMTRERSNVSSHNVVRFFLISYTVSAPYPVGADHMYSLLVHRSIVYAH